MSLCFLSSTFFLSPLPLLMLKLKQPKCFLSLAAGTGIVALALGGVVSCTRLVNEQTPSTRASQFPHVPTLEQRQVTQSAVAALASLAPAERAAPLADMAKKGKARDRSRARYLLANDLMQQQQQEMALDLLQGLEQHDPALAGHVLLKQAQAHASSGNTTAEQATWEEILQQHPNHPVAAEALFALGKTDAQYWDRAITEFPAHPRSLEIVQQRLRQDPKQLPLLKLMARHGSHLPGIGSVAERLVKDYKTQLQPEDWQAIADIYWQKWDYGKAGKAYANAPRTPRNAYRTGRGLQLGGKRTAAYAAYQQLLQDFPQTDEAGTALIRLARINASTEGLAYLDQLSEQFPDRAPEALLEKAKIFDKLNSAKSAAQARESVLTQYATSDAAAEYRWNTAQKLFKQGKTKQAWEWAKPILENNPQSELAPEAGFWLGKWALRLGSQKTAQVAFERVLAAYPESYYAWRSAVLLGLPVGDFNTVRQLSPQVVRPPQRQVLPAGSETLQALYELGQDRDAWALWKVEFGNKKDPTVEEQFTDGLIRLGVGDNLQGIAKISSLEWREDPEEKEQHQALKQQPDYWHALYPFPFLAEIERWSQERQLNPMLVTALIRQESRFEPEIRSVVGATGLMQVMPGTGAWVAEKIDLEDYSLEKPEDNVNLGTWYLDYTHREYNNNSLYAVASYNAGPGNVAKWIREKKLTDPDEFVDAIPFKETRGYVKAVFENYWNYMRLYNPEISQLVASYAKRR